jgi:AbrB family looped-hinge helix DNA binding protein
MPLVKIGPKHQITIPKDVFDSLRLEVGDFMETNINNNTLVLVPKKLVSKEQEWFWSKEWQQMEKEADEAIQEGNIIGPFTNADDAIKALKE